MKKTIFLDFDGVLHTFGKGSSGMFEHMDLFCNSIRPYMNEVEIVISSSWRESFKLQEIKNFFPEDLEHLVVGFTPVHENNIAREARQREIQEYCLHHHITHWIALDDAQDLFSEDCSQLLLVDSHYGLTQENINDLICFISAPVKQNLKL